VTLTTLKLFRGAFEAEGLKLTAVGRLEPDGEGAGPPDKKATLTERTARVDSRREGGGGRFVRLVILWNTSVAFRSLKAGLAGRSGTPEPLRLLHPSSDAGSLSP